MTFARWPCHGWYVARGTGLIVGMPFNVRFSARWVANTPTKNNGKLNSEFPAQVSPFLGEGYS